jgi:NAD+ synthase
MDCETVYQKLVSDTKASFEKAGFSKAVLGLSGGIDSALTAFVLADALGKENVTAIFMPCKGLGYKQDRADAESLAKSLGIDFETVPIDSLVDAVKQSVKWKQSRIAEMNAMVRARMIVLYDFANSNKALVVGTGNKSELMLGYFTKHGDGAADFMPLANLFKSDLYEIAKFKALPQNILEKKPSAGLAPGQTDEEELGASYAEIDPILRAIDAGKGEEELKQEFEAGLVASLLERINANKHKKECRVC